jgi:sialidase-1
MYFRTALGSIYQSFSSNQGATWTKPEPTQLEAPVSPAIMKRIPSTDDLLLVWNHTLPHSRTGHSDRFPLTSAISHDEAGHWEKLRDFETDVHYTYGYPSITFSKDRALITYWAARDWPWWVGLKVKSIPIRWFYQPDIAP